MNRATYTIETTRRLLADEGFKSRHRASAQAFTRVRCEVDPLSRQFLAEFKVVPLHLLVAGS